MHQAFYYLRGLKTHSSMRFMILRQANTNIMCICARREYTFYCAEDGAVLCISITHGLTEHTHVLLSHSEGASRRNLAACLTFAGQITGLSRDGAMSLDVSSAIRI